MLRDLAVRHPAKWISVHSNRLPFAGTPEERAWARRLSPRSSSKVRLFRRHADRGVVEGTSRDYIGLLHVSFEVIMKTVAKVSELKARLSRYLDRVKAGQEVVITDRGTPVAKLVPIPAAEGDDERRLEEMERRGLIRRGAGRLPVDFWDWPRPEDPDGLVLKALLEDRETDR
jgi:prevent-host-death family protein